MLTALVLFGANSTQCLATRNKIKHLLTVVMRGNTDTKGRRGLQADETDKGYLSSYRQIGCLFYNAFIFRSGAAEFCVQRSAWIHKWPEHSVHLCQSFYCIQRSKCTSALCTVVHFGCTKRKTGAQQRPDTVIRVQFKEQAVQCPLDTWQLPRTQNQ